MEAMDHESLVFVSPDLRPGIAEAVQGFADSGVLKQFISTIVLEGGTAPKWMKRLPISHRRQLGNLEAGKVTTYPIPQLIRAVASHITNDEILLDKFWWWAERSFDQKVARNWAGEAPFLYGFELASAETFREQKRRGGHTILSQLIAHHKTLLGLMKEEMERYPDAVTDYDRHLFETAGRVNRLKDEQFELSDLIMANSDFVKQSFVNAGIAEEKIVVVPGAAPILVQAAPGKRKPYRVIFLSAGSQSIRKGTPYLLEAWRQLKTHAGAELWLVGKSTLPPRLLNDLPGTVVVKSTVSQAQLFDLYTKASVLVLPSLCEGFALVILEAMAHGLPVITTANSGCGNFVEDGVNGWIVPIRDADALARRMDSCIENTDDLAEMGEVSLLKASSWTWDDYSELHSRMVYSFTKNTSAAELVDKKFSVERPAFVQ